MVLFEAPHRIHESLADIQTVLGERPIVLGRELTKRHETLLRGTAAELARQLGPNVKGEISLAIAGASVADRHATADRDRVCDCWQEALRESGGDRRSALRTAARVLGMKRAELYRYLAELGQVDAR